MSVVLAEEIAPTRLFFSDAKLSFVIPEPWEVPSSFPLGPLLTRKTQEGSQASIVCEISAPVNPGRLSVDASTDVLKAFAMQSMAAQAAGARLLAATARTLAGHNAYEVTRLTEDLQGAFQTQSVYFFIDNRYYALSLRARRESFPWIVQEFQDWLGSIHLLSRDDSGKLAAPAHGGLWVHQTAGAKITIPENWLVGVADDRQVGATLAHDKMHLDFTAGTDVVSPAPQELGIQEKDAARRALDQKGYTIVSESQEPFHGYPCFRILYEGTIDGRYVRGQDFWVSSPKARWLISLSGDGSFLRQRSDEWQGILNGIQFYE